MRNTKICIYILSQQESFDAIQNYCHEFIKKNNHSKCDIFTNIFECAKRMTEFEADIVFVDDSLLDKLNHTFLTLKPKEMLFTLKRIVVFTTKTKILENRLLELSLFGVRNSFVGIKNFPFALNAIYTQITNFLNMRPKISLCLSGGGFDGYMYSLGVCFGLEMCLQDFQMKDFDVFCGISSGAILSSCFAGGINTTELVHQIHNKHPILEPISFCTFFDFALSDFIKTVSKRQMPIGIFKGEKFKNFFSHQIEYLGLEDSLENLNKNLYILATDQDTGEIVVLGKDPWKKNIKISQAIRASIALPPFFLPENINGHWFTDGQLATSMDFDLPLHEKSSLVIVIEPIVSYSSTHAGGVKRRGGYFTLLQAIKNLVYSRGVVALQHARDKHPDVDFIKFQPTNEIMEMMSGNPMRIPMRPELIEASARDTFNQVLEKYDSFQHKFLKHGLTLKSRSVILQIYENIHT